VLSPLFFWVLITMRSWNEMKTVRSLRENGECHPSIIAFDCFIISPSYALIVMYVAPG
jgi:hypothetical protein